MAKVTSKLQLTIPRKIADLHGIHPGSELEFESLGENIRLSVTNSPKPTFTSLQARLDDFDRATLRQAARDEKLRKEHPELFSEKKSDRGWTREELYDRGFPR